MQVGYDTSDECWLRIYMFQLGKCLSTVSDLNVQVTAAICIMFLDTDHAEVCSTNWYDLLRSRKITRDHVFW